MAIDDHGDAETRACFLDQRRQRRVIGPVEVREPVFRFGHRQAPAVDLEPVANDARDHAQPGVHMRARALGLAR